MGGLFRTLSSWLIASILGVLVSSCASYLEKPYNRVIVGAGMGAVLATVVAGTQPHLGLYVLAGAGMGGSAVAVHELAHNPCAWRVECYPRVAPQEMVKKDLLDEGVGYLGNIPEMKNQMVTWKLYQSGFWLRNNEGQYLYVDKIVEFKKSPE